MSQKFTSTAPICAMFLGAFALLPAAVDAPVPKVDNKLLFHYVKYLERRPADAELTASAPRVSFAMPGMFEVTGYAERVQEFSVSRRRR